jgi:flagellar assembly protein FliH
MKKFLFDTIDFDAPEVSPEELGPSFNQDDMETARKDALAMGDARGYARGRSEAEVAAQEAVEEKLRLLLESLSIGIGRLAAAEDRREMEKCIDAARLALHVVHKLMPQLAATHGLPEVERVISAAIDARREEPRLAVTVPTALLAPLRERVDLMAQERGFAGKVILLADDAMAPSDCRVEWADGGTERILSRLMMHIEGEFSRALSGMQSAAEPLPAQGHDTEHQPETGTEPATDTTDHSQENA